MLAKLLFMFTVCIVINTVVYFRATASDSVSFADIMNNPLVPERNEKKENNFKDFELYLDSIYKTISKGPDTLRISLIFWLSYNSVADSIKIEENSGVFNEFTKELTDKFLDYDFGIHPFKKKGMRYRYPLWVTKH